MEKAAHVGKKNTKGWKRWYRTLGNQNSHEVLIPSAGDALLLSRELQEEIPPPSEINRHLSIRSVHFSNDVGEYIAHRTSKYRHKTSKHTQIPSPDKNIVEVQLIQRGGTFVVRKNSSSTSDKEITTFFTPVYAVQKWMENAFSDSRLFVYVKQKEM